ncbi:MAG: hypothetical protein BWY52_02438 [Chloroflexi bacterium ADurb.Bin325]|nr:MAG: hypothetical protein BWY52_02438 [Chloroflexi bacterium ADurb.Bin325]
MSDQISLYDLFGDLVIYRDLNAVDARLPRFADIWREVGLPGPATPRKLDEAYAQALARLIGAAAHGRMAEIVYIGDTMLSDGGAFFNLRRHTGWRGWCFIGAEKEEALEVVQQDGLYQANRWRALADFAAWLCQQGAQLAGGTVVLVDIDKTLLGARGRNDRAIDRARVAAIEATLAETLGPSYDHDAFRRAYAALNVPKYHPFTADNQDFLAYTCMMLLAGAGTLEGLLAEIEAGRLASYRDFMQRVDAQKARLAPAAVVALHDDIYARTLAGDLTPFKAFRRREYRETVARMGSLPEGTPLAQRFVEEICATQEVVDIVRWLASRGCLLVALSDKPDEATTPTPELAAAGYPPLHRKAVDIVGPSIAGELPKF